MSTRSRPLAAAAAAARPLRQMFRSFCFVFFLTIEKRRKLTTCCFRTRFVPQHDGATPRENEFERSSNVTKGMQHDLLTTTRRRCAKRFCCARCRPCSQTSHSATSAVRCGTTNYPVEQPKSTKLFDLVFCFDRVRRVWLPIRR